jgi:protocatechuate 3,4-dioxygenase alpha subunit
VAARTPSQTVGPFFSFSLCRDGSLAELVPPESDGAVEISGRVLDGAGEVVPDAMVEIWQADTDGTYRSDFGWGRSGTSDAGEYRLVTTKPGPLAADDGAVHAPHLDVLVFARGLLKPVHTRMYFPDEEAANAADPALAVLADADRAALVATGESSRLRFDIRLQGERQTPFYVH